ncbi:MAG TPA: hypothetical protein VG455_07435 [Acidimicrobiales bacterium]|nr:hypothetical protein [Acidimicrobiales bacterium]
MSLLADQPGDDALDAGALAGCERCRRPEAVTANQVVSYRLREARRLRWWTQRLVPNRRPSRGCLNASGLWPSVASRRRLAQRTPCATARRGEQDHGRLGGAEDGALLLLGQVDELRPGALLLFGDPEDHNAAIAASLVPSERAVEKHINSLFSKRSLGGARRQPAGQGGPVVPGRPGGVDPTRERVQALCR